MSKTDIVFARTGFDLERIILAGERNGIKVKVEANVKFWSDGFDILQRNDLFNKTEWNLNKIMYLKLSIVYKFGNFVRITE